MLKASKGLVLGAVAVSLTAIGWQFIGRSTSATLTASAATVAISQASRDDRKAYDTCVQGKADWLRGRMDHSNLENLLEDLSGPPSQ